jgi:hypothetical protein
MVVVNRNPLDVLAGQAFPVVKFLSHRNRGIDTDQDMSGFSADFLTVEWKAAAESGTPTCAELP